MGCQSCKDKDKSESLNIFRKNKSADRLPAKKEDIVFRLFNIVVRLFMFLIGVILTPAITLFIIYLLFKTIVLNNGQVNLTPSLLKIATTLNIGKKKVEDENPEDYEDLDVDKPEDYELDEKIDKIVL
jgi:hypothetical protein